MSTKRRPRMTSPFPHLFQTIRLGRREAKNRIMRVATTSNLAEQNRVGERLIGFYQALAEGGVGTIVTEALRALPEDAFQPSALAVHDRAAIPGLRRLAEVCHGEGALLVGQLNNTGRQHLAARVPAFSIAPSAIACPRSGGVPHALTTAEVKAIIARFVEAAAICVEGGMDGVEIHGAQGHLIGQFLSPYTNVREDDYGGSAENRLRFAREIIEGVRARVGRTAIVGYRLGAEEFTAGGLGAIDYLSLSQGNFNTIETHLPDRHWPAMPYRDLHARFKADAPDLPVIACTRIAGPEQAEEVLAAGHADMVGLCRPLIADPDWPRKAEAGRADDIRRCIACNQCWGWISGGEPIACAINPQAGREHALGPLTRASRRRHVAVVGGGPAGLEAARIAAKRGHRVTLLEREAQLGGRLARVHELPHHAEMGNLIAFLTGELAHAKVAVRTGALATPALLRELDPDEIIIATGAEPVAPGLPGDGSVPVRTGNGHIGLKGTRGKTVVVLDEDGYYWTEAVATSVLEQGRKLVLVTRFFEVLRELPMVSRIAALRELDGKGALLRTSTTVARAAKGSVVLAHYLTGREEVIADVAAVAWIGPAVARGGLKEELIAAGFAAERIRVVGDAFAPRRLVHALGEAHRAARAIGAAATKQARPRTRKR